MFILKLGNLKQFQNEKGEKFMGKKILRIVQTLALPAVLLIIMKIVYPENITMGTVVNMIYQAIAPAILAFGVCFNLKVGNWDFSVGAAALAAAIIGGNLAKMLNLGIVGVFVFCILVGACCGLLTGVLYLFLKVPTIIASIGVVFLLESLCGIAFNGGGVMLSGDYIVLKSVGLQILIGAIVFAFSFYLYNYRSFGYHIRAVGSNANVATQNGINVYRVKFKALVTAGTFAGIYAAVTLGTTGVYRTVTASMGTMNTCFDAMMCVFVGMALSMFTNLFVGIFVGAVTLKILTLLLMLTGVQSAYNQIFIAVFVLIFLCYSTYTDLKKMKQSQKWRVITETAGN